MSTYFVKKIKRSRRELTVYQTLRNQSDYRVRNFILDWQIRVISARLYLHLPLLTSIGDELVKPMGGCLLREGVALCRQLLVGVDFLHSLQIAHMDIKPNNLLITEDKTLKIIDFDLSLIHCDKDAEVHGGSRGTSGFMAPEVSGKGTYNPFKADCYSCGCCLKEFLDKLHQDSDKRRQDWKDWKKFAKKLRKTEPMDRPALLTFPNSYSPSPKSISH